MIIVSGCARSGTSLTTQVLAACGANLGKVVGRVYENVSVREKTVKPYLRSIGADPLGQDPLPSRDDVVVNEYWINKFRKSPLEADCIKNAKFSLIMPLMIEAFPEAKWVFCRRDIDQIAASCLSCYFMQAYRTHEEWKEWAEQYIDRLYEVDHLLDFVEVRPEEAITGHIHEFKHMVEFCGLEWNEEEVGKVIRPGLWNKRTIQ